MNILTRQMELSFDAAQAAVSVVRRPRRLARAQWWFERMRSVVDRALDGQPTPVPPPEQIWFPQ